MDKKTIIATVSGLAIAAVFALLWNTFAKGVESTVADNPAIVSIKDDVEENGDAIQAILISHAAIDAKLGLVIDNQNKILDKLIP